LKIVMILKTKLNFINFASKICKIKDNKIKILFKF
jgi:hypothetical protein